MTEKAFTLAEVLITLAIIGVVAAMTIPVLVADYKYNAASTAFKKVFSVLKQAELFAVTDYGDTSYWDWNADVVTIVNTYYKPYLKVIKDCGNTDNSCWTGRYKYLNGTYLGETWPSLSSRKYKFVLSDGIVIDFDSRPTATPGVRQAVIHFDTNGAKGPNQVGRDVFMLDVYAEEGITIPRENNCLTSAGNPSNGWSCGREIMSGVKYF